MIPVVSFASVLAACHRANQTRSLGDVAAAYSLLAEYLDWILGLRPKPTARA